MANVKLLRQRVTDYKRSFDRSRRTYLNEHDKYSADSDAFQAHYGQYPVREGDQVVGGGTLYYDRETDSVKDVYGRDVSKQHPMIGYGGALSGHNLNTAAVSKTYDYGAQGSAHMDAAKLVKVGDKWVSSSSPEAAPVIAAAKAEYDLGLEQYNNNYTGDGYDQPYPDFKPHADAYWDAYSNTWRNYRAAPGAPEQRRVPAPNLTEKEIGLLEGKLDYANIAMETTSPTSAFADPEDPYNLKDAGVLTRAIAGKI